MPLLAPLVSIDHDLRPSANGLCWIECGFSIQSLFVDVRR
jgi:hypothetical protein